jgi:uncharacterized membrane protein YkvA (DUF1232 family)
MSKHIDQKFEEAYSEESFWSKVTGKLAKGAKKGLEKILTLYFCLRDSDTPFWAKSTITSALGYFIFPVDVIPDPLPLGYADDMGVIALALVTVAAHIKKEHRERAVRILSSLRGAAQNSSE